MKTKVLFTISLFCFTFYPFGRVIANFDKSVISPGCLACRDSDCNTLSVGTARVAAPVFRKNPRLSMNQVMPVSGWAGFHLPKAVPAAAVSCSYSLDFAELSTTTGADPGNTRMASPVTFCKTVHDDVNLREVAPAGREKIVIQPC